CPDCRPPRKRGTQYAAAVVRRRVTATVSGILDRPVKPDDDKFVLPWARLAWATINSKLIVLMLTHDSLGKDRHRPHPRHRRRTPPEAPRQGVLHHARHQRADEQPPVGLGGRTGDARGKEDRKGR